MNRQNKAWRKRGRKPAMGRKTYPLRKIVGGSYGYLPGEHSSLFYETLECGHRATPRQDLIGETNAERRRCLKCKMGKPPDVEPEGGDHA